MLALKNGVDGEGEGDNEDGGAVSDAERAADMED